MFLWQIIWLNKLVTKYMQNMLLSNQYINRNIFVGKIFEELVLNTIMIHSVSTLYSHSGFMGCFLRLDRAYIMGEVTAIRYNFPNVTRAVFCYRDSGHEFLNSQLHTHYHNSVHLKHYIFKLS